jgi:antitoxin (DNA-binding transcriptional repressor) of toxin-antitoxin stability system
MRKIGIFEAKTKFSSLCEAISKGGQPVVVEKRDRPMVMIAPVPPTEEQTREDILTAWQQWNHEHPEGDTNDFPEVWKMRSDRIDPPTDPS